jgi:penicillin amidase
VKPLDRFFNVGPFPAAGGSEVINNLDFTYTINGIFDVSSGPALRKITDFARIDSGVTISPTGQSGNVMSPHYDDQAEMFIKGEFRPMLMNQKQITSFSKNKLTFTP